MLLNKADKIKLFKKAEIFKLTSDSALCKLADKTEVVYFSGNCEIIKKDTLSDRFFVLASGTVKVHDDLVVIATLTAGSTIGEMGIIDGSKRSATVTSLGPTTLLQIKADDLFNLIEENPIITKGLILELVKKIKSQNQVVVNKLKQNESNLRELIKQKTEEISDKNIELATANKHLEMLVENSNEVLAVYDTELNFVFGNHSPVEKILGYNIEEIKSLVFTELLLENNHTIFNEKINELKTFKKPFFNFLCQVKTKNGLVINVNLTTKSIIKNNKVKYFVIIFNENINVRAQKNYSQTAFDKDYFEVFLATISHETRTPLYTLSGITELLLQKNNHTDDKPNLLLLKDTVKQLNNKIDSIIDYYQLYSGDNANDLINFNLELLIRSLIKTFKTRAERRQIDMQVLTDINLPSTLCADHNKLYLILKYLFENAFQFLKNGKISFTVSLNETVKQEKKIKFSIILTDVSLNEKYWIDVMGKLENADLTPIKEQNGISLGLAVAYGYLKTIGSKLNINVDQIKNTTNFWFEVSLIICEETQIAKQLKPISDRQKEKIINKKILLAEDNGVNRMVATKYLKTYGWQVVAVENGLKAVEEVEKSKFDLVILDLEMPVLDGFEAAKRIRKILNIPLIAFSATTLNLNQKNEANFYFDDYLSKTYSPSDLVEKVANLLSTYNIKNSGTDIEYKPDPKTENITLKEAFDIPNVDAVFLKQLKNEYISTIDNFCKMTKLTVKQQDAEYTRKSLHEANSPFGMLNAIKLKTLGQGLIKAHQMGDNELENNILREIELEANRIKELIEKYITNLT